MLSRFGARNLHGLYKKISLKNLWANRVQEKKRDLVEMASCTYHYSVCGVHAWQCLCILQGRSQTFVWVGSFGGKGGPFLWSKSSMQSMLKLRGSEGMLPQENFLKINAQKAKFGNFSVTK